MQAVSYYLLAPFIYLISVSPFWLLYRFSDAFYVLIYYIAGYRKKVVISNLKKSFPDKSDKEIKQITKKFYKYLCDLMMETLKTITWKEKHVLKRLKMNNVELLDGLHAEGKSILLVMGHLGNWEWAGPCFTLSCKHQLNVVYLPLSNKYFEKMMCRARTKFNTEITPKKDVLRRMIANKSRLMATALIADQAPTPIKAALWMDFLNQDTPVFNGPEKIANMMDHAVVYINIDRVKRGHYEITPTLLFDKPKETEEEQITRTFNQILEKDIIRKPETWLWSHRRWKHKRPTE